MDSSLNLILITIDALRADQVGCINGDATKTPNLNRLAKNGYLFKEAISNGPYTSPSLISLFSSYCPGTLPSEIVNPMRANPCHRFSLKRPSFVDFLRNKSYRTGGIIDSNPYASSHFGFDRGFNFFEDFMGPAEYNFLEKSWHAIGKKAVSWMSRRPTLRYLLPRNPIMGANGITKLALQWIKNRESNFFLWIHFMDVHAPYIPLGTNLNAARWVERRFLNYGKPIEDMSKADLGCLFELYEEAVSYVDRSIGSFLDSLESLGHSEDTYLIVTSDHGEEFGEHGSWGGHKAKLYEELIRVPLIISGPEIPETIVTSQVSLINLAITILDLLGISNISKSGQKGQNMMHDFKTEKPAITEFYSRGRRGVSYRRQGWKYIIRMPITRKTDIEEELYDLTNDPAEKKNVIAECVKRANLLRNQVRRHFKEEKQDRERLILKKKIGSIKNRNFIL